MRLHSNHLNYKRLAKTVIVLIALFIGNGINAEEVLYAPPFQQDKRFLIVQGFNGEFSHQNALSRYAVDLAMPAGEPVCAARAGVVVKLNQDGDESVSQFVHIEHQDKTIGDYEHLQVGSIQVAVGQAVEEGECFARVGNTGYSTGPHLHFAVLREQGFPWFSLFSQPFEFKAKIGSIVPTRLLWLGHQ